jgi:hypothetical protein
MYVLVHAKHHHAVDVKFRCSVRLARGSMEMRSRGWHMGVRSATEAIMRQEWLSPVEETLQHGIHWAFPKWRRYWAKIENALHGTGWDIRSTRPSEIPLAPSAAVEESPVR